MEHLKSLTHFFQWLETWKRAPIWGKGVVLRDVSKPLFVCSQCPRISFDLRQVMLPHRLSMLQVWKSVEHNSTIKLLHFLGLYVSISTSSIYIIDYVFDFEIETHKKTPCLMATTSLHPAAPRNLEESSRWMATCHSATFSQALMAAFRPMVSGLKDA